VALLLFGITVDHRLHIPDAPPTLLAVVLCLVMVTVLGRAVIVRRLLGSSGGQAEAVPGSPEPRRH
jgi:hypothetical protein